MAYQRPRRTWTTTCGAPSPSLLTETRFSSTSSLTPVARSVPGPRPRTRDTITTVTVDTTSLTTQLEQNTRFRRLLGVSRGAGDLPPLACRGSPHVARSSPLREV